MKLTQKGKVKNVIIKSQDEIMFLDHIIFIYHFGILVFLCMLITELKVSKT